MTGLKGGREPNRLADARTPFFGIPHHYSFLETKKKKAIFRPVHFCILLFYFFLFLLLLFLVLYEYE